MSRTPDVVTAVTTSQPIDGKRRRRARTPRPRTGRPEVIQMHPDALDAAWRLRREGEVMRAVGSNIIVLAHPGSAAYVKESSR